MVERNYLIYEAYGHGEARTEPVRTSGAIYGVELEIGSVYDYGGLNEAIDAGLIETADSGEANVQLEYEAQGDVEFELIFNADYKKDVLARVSSVYDYLGSGFDNHRQTSCHIHSSREYLEECGIDELSFFKAAEAIAPLIYTISGRDEAAWYEWTRSAIDKDYRLIARMELIEDAKPRRSTRYRLCNVTNADTIEIRGFSNYCECDPDTIELYLDVVADLIPAIAVAMDGKSYTSDFEIVFRAVNTFLDSHPLIEKLWDVNDWRNYAPQVLEWKREKTAAVIRMYNSNLNLLQQAREYLAHGEKYAAARTLLQAMENNSALALDNLDLQAIGAAADKMEAELNRIFKNAVWKL